MINLCNISIIESKSINDIFKDEYWVNVMHEELEYFVRNDKWKLVENPNNVNVTRTKWIFKHNWWKSGYNKKQSMFHVQGYS